MGYRKQELLQPPEVTVSETLPEKQMDYCNTTTGCKGENSVLRNTCKFCPIYLHRTFLRCWPKHTLLNTQLLSGLSFTWELSSLQHSKLTGSSAPSKKSHFFPAWCKKQNTNVISREEKRENCTQQIHTLNYNPDSNVLKKQREHLWQTTDTFRNCRRRNVNCNFWYLWSSQELFLFSCFHFWTNPERALSWGKLTLPPWYTAILQQQQHRQSKEVL